MTREEVVKWLKSLKREIGKTENRTLWHYAESIDMAIEALAERPTESDFISKAKVLETYSELYWFDIDCGVVSKAEVDKIYERLQSLPSADRPTVDKEYLIDLIQEAVYDGEACAKLIGLVDRQTDGYYVDTRPTGEWVDDCTCSICHWMHEDNNGFALITKYNYCPNCGARMEGGEEE